MDYSSNQREVVRLATEGTVFLEGPAGAGKTTVGAAVLAALLESGVPGAEILVLVPQRTLALPYYDVLDMPNRGAGGQVNVHTLGGLARRAVDIFWPLVAEEHGFQKPDLRPVFLSLETAQYYMARVAGPVIDERGMFESVTIDRNRLYSQILDNLNKSAVVGFPHTQIGDRLKAAWSGDSAQLTMYDDVQTCANLFRAFCLEYCLLDFSLQVEVFARRLWALPQCRAFHQTRSRHIIADNVEEDSPAAHTILVDLLRDAESALVILDTKAGYRRFLGADPDDAHHRLPPLCDRLITFGESFVPTGAVAAFGTELARSLDRPAGNGSDADPRDAIQYDHYRYHPEMVDGVVEAITGLVRDQGVLPKEIVVVAPYLSDALRFSLMNRLQVAGVPVRSHRPSRPLRQEPAAQCLLTLARLAHPEWSKNPAGFDVVYMLLESIADLDLVRGQLLAQAVYKANTLSPQLAPFEQVDSTIQERITFVTGERYERLKDWIADYQADQASGAGRVALDHFFSRLFGEVLSQPGFGFHDDFDAAETAANLIESARRFRLMIEESGLVDLGKTPAQEYVEMVAQGIIADQYLPRWTMIDEEAVLLAPAYTFLMSNRPVDYQFWLNVGGRGWSERLYQPLTNPYVLTVDWPEGKQWTDFDEVEVGQEALYRLVTGLVHRCRKGIYLGFSELGEQGYEQRGELLQAVQRMLMRLH